MLKFPISLDCSATTPVDPRVAEQMIPWLVEKFGNPASRSHAYGWEAEKAVEDAREQVARLVNADPKEIVWTSGATESNNLAIKGAAHFHRGKGKHLITVATEHKAVLDSMRELEREGTVPGCINAPRGMLEFWVDPDSPYYKPVFGDESRDCILFCGAGWRSALSSATGWDTRELELALQAEVRSRFADDPLASPADPRL